MTGNRSSQRLRSSAAQLSDSRNGGTRRAAQGGGSRCHAERSRPASGRQLVTCIALEEPSTLMIFDALEKGIEAILAFLSTANVDNRPDDPLLCR